MSLSIVPLVYLAGFLAAVFGGLPLVEGVLRFFKPENGDDELSKAGMTIGVFERMIVVLLVFVHAYDAIGLVVAAKSVARFKQLKERPFAEYYLIGTLASISFAVVIGLLTLVAVQTI